LTETSLNSTKQNPFFSKSRRIRQKLLAVLALNFTPTIEEAPKIRQGNKTTKALYNFSLEIEPPFLLQPKKCACLVVGLDPKEVK
jgi:hypothetical protein